MKKRYYLMGLMTLLGIFLLMGCQKAPTQKAKGLSIVTSFYPIYAITQEVAGDLNDVRMIHSSQGIHGFEPSPGDLTAIGKADVFIYHSRTLESWTKNFKEVFKDEKVKLMEASEGLPLQKVEGLEDVKVMKGMDKKALYDPHTWLDPKLAGKEAKHIAFELGKIDPKNKATYQKNAEAFASKAEQLSDTMAKRFSKTKSKTFVTQHTAFAYVASRYGLKQLGLAGISDDIEPNSRRMGELTDFVKENKVKTIFAEPQTSPKSAKTLAHATGAKVKRLDPLERDPENKKSYLENLQSNLEVIAKDLEER